MKSQRFSNAWCLGLCVGSLLLTAQAHGDPPVEDLDLLIGRLKEGSGYSRSVAAEKIGDLGDKRAVRPLLTCLKDQDPRVRKAAATALGKLGDPRALDPLTELLNDRDPSFREVAAGALGNLADKRAIEPLIALRWLQKTSIGGAPGDKVWREEKWTYPDYVKEALWSLSAKRVAVVDESKKLHPWNEKVPKQWRASSLDEADFLVLLGEQKKKAVGRQSYTQGGRSSGSSYVLTRYRYDLDAVLIKRGTRTRISEGHFFTLPEYFASAITLGAGDLGKEVPFADVEVWLLPALARAAKAPKK